MPGRFELDHDRELDEAGLEAVPHRVAEVAQRLRRVHGWMCGRTSEPITQQDAVAVAEAARHFRWIAEVFNRRSHRGTK